MLRTVSCSTPTPALGLRALWSAPHADAPWVCTHCVPARPLTGYRARRHNLVHPAVGPTSADGAVVQFLLAHAK